MAIDALTVSALAELPLARGEGLIVYIWRCAVVAGLALIFFLAQLDEADARRGRIRLGSGLRGHYGSGGSSDTTSKPQLSREELRRCLSLEPSLNVKIDSVNAVEAGLERDRLLIDDTSSYAVDSFNSRVQAYNRSISELDLAVASFNTSCANKTYSDVDLAIIEGRIPDVPPANASISTSGATSIASVDRPRTSETGEIRTMPVWGMVVGLFGIAVLVALAEHLTRPSKTSSSMAASQKITIPPDVQDIINRLKVTLESDEAQNRLLPEPARRQIAGGLDCDVLPTARGEFGRTPMNPIPTNGPVGEVLYLSRLRTNTGKPVMFHRVGSVQSDVGGVDIYEVLSTDGRVSERLFLSMYHPRKSRRVPSGYSYAPALNPKNYIYGVNHNVEDFPYKLDTHIRQWQVQTLGVPLLRNEVRDAISVLNG